MSVLLARAKALSFIVVLAALSACGSDNSKVTNNPPSTAREQPQTRFDMANGCYALQPAGSSSLRKLRHKVVMWHQQHGLLMLKHCTLNPPPLAITCCMLATTQCWLRKQIIPPVAHVLMSLRYGLSRPYHLVYSPCFHRWLAKY